MSYKYYNANALGNLTEDCTVRSISCALDMSWDRAYNMLSNEARLQGEMMDNASFIIRFLDARFERVPELGYTVGETVEMYPNSVLILTMDNHITCAKHGEIFDVWNCENKPIQEAWIIR